jgi:hypothetical protein
MPFVCEQDRKCDCSCKCHCTDCCGSCLSRVWQYFHPNTLFSELAFLLFTFTYPMVISPLSPAILFEPFVVIPIATAIFLYRYYHSSHLNNYWYLLSLASDFESADPCSSAV